MLKSKKISGPTDRVNFYYAGAVICGANFSSGQVFAHNLTLKFKQPAVATVTFAAIPPGPQTPIPMADIISQIKTAVPALEPRLVREGNVMRLVLIEATPASGVTVDKTGTVNSLFGLSDSADTEGQFINPPGGATPYLVWLSAIDANTYIVTTEE